MCRAHRHRKPGVAPDCADVRIDDGQVHAGGHIGEGSLQHECAGAHVVARDTVCDVDHLRGRAAPGDHPLADTHELISVAVVGEEGDKRGTGHL